MQFRPGKQLVASVYKRTGPKCGQRSLEFAPCLSSAFMQQLEHAKRIAGVRRTIRVERYRVAKGGSDRIQGTCHGFSDTTVLWKAKVSEFTIVSAHEGAIRQHHRAEAGILVHIADQRRKNLTGRIKLASETAAVSLAPLNCPHNLRIDRQAERLPEH